MLSNVLSLRKVHDFAVGDQPRLVVVFIHGIAADSSSFDHAIQYLEGLESLQDVRFVAFDLLGFGQSLCSDELNYSYAEQVEALHDSIKKLKIGDAPLVLVGHSMGTLITTRYADTYKNTVKKLILVSPPVYTEQDLENPAFAAGMKLFQEAVAVKSRKILESKAFKNSIDKIILDRRNFKVLTELRTPAVLIYGSKDQFIASYNIPHAIKANPEYLTAIKTEGRHGVSRDKYTKIAGVLEEVLNDQTI